jgi:hypothetical protein
MRMKPGLEHFVAISRLTVMKNYYNLFRGLGIEFGTKSCIGLREMIVDLSKTYNLLSLPPYTYHSNAATREKSSHPEFPSAQDVHPDLEHARSCHASFAPRHP